MAASLPTDPERLSLLLASLCAQRRAARGLRITYETRDDRLALIARLDGEIDEALAALGAAIHLRDIDAHLQTVTDIGEDID